MRFLYTIDSSCNPPWLLAELRKRANGDTAGRKKKSLVSLVTEEAGDSNASGTFRVRPEALI